MELGIRLSEQLLTFVYAILFGMLAGGLFEVFRLFRALVRGGVILVAIQDILYWLIVSFGMYSFFLVFTEGAVRGYVILGAGLGLLVYLGSVGRLFSFLYRKVIRPMGAKLRRKKQKI